MQIHQIPVRNALRNYMYLLVCEDSNEALAIDPLDYQKCLTYAKDLAIDIKYVANTHHHHDHIGGNQDVIKATGASLLAHEQAVTHIPNVDRGLSMGDSVEFGGVHLEVMDTPGHTMSHICLLYKGDGRQSSALFCGDTLFNAGVGRCDSGGDPEILYKTFSQQIFTLDDEVRVFPGHDYIENNLGFTLEYESENIVARDLLSRFQNGEDSESFVSTIGLERQINTFFRLKNATIRKRFATVDDKSTFIALRRARDNW